MKEPTAKELENSSKQEVSMSESEAMDRVVALRKRFLSNPLENMDNKMEWPEPITAADELAQDKRAYERRKMRSATRQELKARQGRSGISMTSLADMLEAQADEQDAKDDTSK